MTAQAPGFQTSRTWLLLETGNIAQPNWVNSANRYTATQTSLDSVGSLVTIQRGHPQERSRHTATPQLAAVSLGIDGSLNTQALCFMTMLYLGQFVTTL